MDKVLEILKGVRPDVDFDHEEELVDAGVIDSFDIIAIVAELNDEFGVDIEAGDLEPQNFNSAQAIWQFVEGRLS